jgi:hypothetical protein
VSGVFKFLGKVSGIASGIAALAGNPLMSAAFAANAAIMNTLGGVTAKKPVPVGSSNNILIGANQQQDQIIGRCYSGGRRVHQIGYGTEDDIPNAHAAMVDIYSGGGPLHAFVGAYADFNLVTFAGDNAVGYYHNNLHFFYQLGATPEGSALAPHWTGLPDWGSAYKLSGKAAAMWNARFPKKGEVFRSGFPQTGTIWDGVLAYDPRADTTYPGGSGSHRWASPTDVSDFTAAKATWSYSTNPGLQALRYALGTWELNSVTNIYLLTFGMGLPYDGIVVEDFVEFANICDANAWTTNGIVSEPGDRWENLKNICAAGAAEPCLKGGRLGLRVSAPKVSLDTITADDLADGDFVIPATRSYRERLNTIIPKFKSSDHRWEYVASNPVQVLDYVAEDGEERSEERQFNLVAGSTEAADQVAQLAAYELVDGRERFPIEIVCKPRLRAYSAGDQITVDIPEAGLADQDCVIMRRSFDPNSMTVSFTLREETTAKHAYALSRTGTSPPAITILPPGEIDGANYGTEPSQISATIRAATVIWAGMIGEDNAGDGKITVADQSWDYPGDVATVDRTGGTITGLDLATRYFVYFDDVTLADLTPTYAASLTQLDAINSVTNPARHYLGFVDIPASGGPPSDGDVGGGGGGCPHEDAPIQMSDNSTKPAGELQPGDMVWAKHEITGMWGAYPVAAVEPFDCDDMYEGVVRGKTLRASGSHLLWHNNGWRMFCQLGQRVENGRAVKIQVTDAHTYVVNGLLSHNKTVEP